MARRHLFPRLPLTEETKRRISAAKLGHPVSEATRAKQRAGRLGKKHTEEAKAKIRAARLAREKTNEQILEECRAAAKARHAAQDALRFRQLKLDIMKASRLGLTEVVADLKQSRGWWCKRKTHHPEISDGYYKRGGRVMRYPWLRALRPKVENGQP